MALPLNLRPHNVFLSHSSRDKLDFVDGLYNWLTRNAGLTVWYDRNLGAGQVAANLGDAIDSSQAAIIVLSRNSVQSQWVQQECSRLQDEVGNSGGDFRIATIRLDDVEAPGLLKSFKHIDVSDGRLTAHGAALLMDSLYGGKDSPAGRSVYLSKGWRPAERPASERICEALQIAGLRLVCDWTGQPHYDATRVRAIMESTGGLVAILPHRGNGSTSNYIVNEIDMARDAGLPVLVFSHADVVMASAPPPPPLLFDADIEKKKGGEIVDAFGNEMDNFVQSLRPTSRGEHVFLGHSLEASIDDKFLAARGMLSRITGLPVKVGGLVAGLEAQSEIVRLIRESGLCIIDITNLTHENIPPKIDFAMNSCIEAGIALGSGKTLYLTCRGPRRSPPFMFRNKQIWFYDDDLELIGNLRQIASLHRRMVI